MRTEATGTCTQRVEICAHPIFVVGSQRSGTSILARALGRHSALWYSVEGFILHRLFGPNRLDELYALHAQKDWRWLSKERVKREEFLEAAGLGINALYTRRSGGRRWIEKTPQNTLMIGVLADMFPGASFVHILRDGRLVVNSMINRVQHWREDFAWACRDWRRSVEAAMEFAARQPERCITVRHEDLTEHPQSVLSDIYRFLEISYEETPVEHVRANRINSSFSNRPAGTPTDPWQEWTAEQRGTFLREAGPAMARYGLMHADELQRLQDTYMPAYVVTTTQEA